MSSTVIPESILTFWRDWMTAQDLTARTITERIRFIRQVDRFIEGGFLTATRQDLIQFMGSDPEWSNTTRAHYRSALHTFYTWLQDEEIRSDNPAAKLPKVKHRKRVPNPVEVADISAAVSSGAYRRTRQMIALHYYALLRGHEIAKVHGRDVDWRNRTIEVLGKGKKVRRVPINDALWEVVKDMPRDGYWFPNWKTNRVFAAGEGHILANSVSRLLAQALRRGGVHGHRPHDLRASGITEQVRAGVHVLVVQENAGHASAATTQLYNLVNLEQKRDGVASITPIEIPERSGRKRAA